MVTYSSIFIIVLFLIITIIISLMVALRSKSGKDFSTGGKSFGWFTAGVSILATYISTMTFIGMPGWVYESGLEVLSVHLNYPIVIFFAVLFFVPVFYKMGLTSIYEYLELRFGIYARTINSLVFILVQCISAGVILYAVALIIIQVFPITIFESIVYMTIFTAAYTYTGGISTGMWTDLFQSAILLTGVIAVLVILLLDIDSSKLDWLTAAQLNIINLSIDPSLDTTLWTGTIALSFLHLSVYGSNQLIIQRTLATRDVHTAQKSMLLCGYSAFFIYALFAALGFLLKVFYQNRPFENSNEVILDFVFHHTNPIIIGLILSALAAAAMSTLNSTYNSIATVVTIDIYKRFFKPYATAHHYEIFTRRMSLVSSLLVILPALLAISNESVLKTIASLTSIFVGVRLGSFLLGLFFVKANEKGVIVGSIASIISVFGCMLAGISWPWYAPSGTLVFLFAGVFTSQYWGGLTKEQISFAHQQRDLFAKPTMSIYGLLFFALITIAICFYVPRWLLSVFY